MLASTMQFSRYGRPRPEARRIRDGPAPVRDNRQTPVPSGPNSVPSHPATAATLPASAKKAVLAGIAGELTE
jgi:hypothetical protein